jgi:hypothetical protein
MTALAALLALAVGADPSPRQDKYFQITVVDEQTGRGVPLVELETVHHVRHYSDSNGVVAFHEPGLMGQTVFFHVRGHGYEFPRDGFGFRGKALRVTEGGSAKLAVRRLNVAERIYRVTGAGIYRDSLLVGRAVPLKRPLLNGLVLGSDSVVSAVYRGKVYWFWGDTMRPAYPLGNYDVPGATSALPAEGGLAPEVGIDLHYFVDDTGFARATAPMPGKGPTWLISLVPLREGKRERLFAAYVKVRNHLDVYERGLAEWDDDKGQFRQVARFDMAAPVYPNGHPFRHSVAGAEYVYFAAPYPFVRVKADAESLRRPERYEAFTCLKEGSRVEEGKVERAGGRVRYAWKRNTPAVGPAEQAKLIKAGHLKPEEALLQLRDADSGKPVRAHGGSVYWNEYRRRWVLIAVERFGTSALGEVWYAEADTPLGPWAYARKVVTHDRYSFYNPKHHPFFDKDKGRVIFFEGTYTREFSGNPEPTPRYDYNQIMYKLDLSDPRLMLPVPIKRLPGAEAGRAAPFFALDRPRKGAVPVYARPAEGGGQALTVGEPPAGTMPLFYALPADAKGAPATAVPLYEFMQKDGKRRAYAPADSAPGAGYRRGDRPLCLVWRNPLRVLLPDE